MRALTSKQMLRVWEEGQGRPLAERALMLLEVTCPEEDRAVLARLPIGERDGRLLTLREMTFGPDMTSVTACPACGERLELGFAVGDLRVEAPPAGELVVVREGYRLGFRLPSSADLEAIRPGEDARMQLFRRCLVAPTRDGRACAVEEIPPAHLDAVAEGMRSADPGADLRALLRCPDCDHRWQARFDIVSFFWEELGARVRRLLQEVHVLASAYGWREDDVLVLTPWRRRYYIGLVRT